MFNTRVDPITIGGHDVYLLREDENPFGSHKAYAAHHFLKSSREGFSNQDVPHQVLLSSSGRMAEAIALMTVGDNYNIHIVTDKLSSTDIISTVASFAHVTVETVNCPDETGSHIKARLKRVEELLIEYPEATFVDQYNDSRIADGYRFFLGPHISSTFPNGIGAVFCPGGTGGLANGLCRFRKDVNGNWPIYVADVEASALMRSPPPNVKRMLSGIGNGIQTGLIREVLDEIIPVWVKDVDSIQTCHDLISSGRMFGGSTGATVAAFRQVALTKPELLQTSAPIVIVCPDAGDAYRNTIYSRDWLETHGFNLAIARSQPRDFSFVR